MSSVALVEDTPGTDGALTADIEIPVSMCPDGKPTAVSPCAMSVDADGTVRLEIKSSQAVVPADLGVTVEPTDATFTGDSDGTVTLTLSVSVPTGSATATDEVDDEYSKPNEKRPTESVGADASDEATTTHQNSNSDLDSHSEPDSESDSELDVKHDHDQDIPPFRDPELLAEVYESCDTFTEMPEALGMDVTAETVRRYMIDFGIHEPNTYNTSSSSSDTIDTETETDTEIDSDTDTGVDTDPATIAGTGVEERAGAEMNAGDDLQTPVVLADGIGLPDDVTVETIIETVQESNTIYEVKRDIGIERENTLDMLRELNLLDLVVGRLATEAERTISREEVIERLRQSASV